MPPHSSMCRSHRLPKYTPVMLPVTEKRKETSPKRRIGCNIDAGEVFPVKAKVIPTAIASMLVAMAKGMMVFKQNGLIGCASFWRKFSLIILPPTRARQCECDPVVVSFDIVAEPAGSEPAD